jgi:dTDP-4-dehydrorhamnose reductase
MKILVTGGSGQLGLALQRQGGAHDLVAFDRTSLDITDAVEVARVFAREQPEAVINCAAWTDVDACEGDPEKAMRINGTAVGTLAREAKNVGAHLVQISTDYVFDGTKKGPYVETDLPNPLSVYGKSKLLGEQLTGHDGLVVRTAWVMGPDGNNMLKTILRLLKGHEILHFVDDQIGCPTFTDDLAIGILELMAKKETGIFHLTNSGAVSWFQFAQEVSVALETNPNRVLPVSTKQLQPPRPAVRPRNSVLNTCFAGGISSKSILRPHHQPLVEVIDQLTISDNNL